MAFFKGKVATIHSLGGNVIEGTIEDYKDGIYTITNKEGSFAIPESDIETIFLGWKGIKNRNSTRI